MLGRELLCALAMEISLAGSAHATAKEARRLCDAMDVDSGYSGHQDMPDLSSDESGDEFPDHAGIAITVLSIVMLSTTVLTTLPTTPAIAGNHRRWMAARARGKRPRRNPSRLVPPFSG